MPNRIIYIFVHLSVHPHLSWWQSNSTEFLFLHKCQWVGCFSSWCMYSTTWTLLKMLTLNKQVLVVCFKMQLLSLKSPSQVSQDYRKLNILDRMSLSVAIWMVCWYTVVSCTVDWDLFFYPGGPTSGTSSTRGRPTRGTGGRPARGTGGRPARGTGGRPARGTGGRPARGTGGRPARGTGGRPARGTGGRPARGTGGRPARGTGGRPARGTGGRPARGTGGRISLSP